MDKILESITRSSEAEIRKKMLPQLLSETHNKKVSRSSGLVNEFVNTLGLDNVYVSTSGGKDSACVSKLCKQQYPQIKHIMFNTRLEYQATINLAKKQGAKIIPSTTSWIEFCEKEGYPVGSKQVSKRIHDVRSGAISCAITLFSKNYGLSDKWLHFLSREFVDFPISQKCCNEFKKRPSHKTGLNPILGTRVQESSMRTSAWKKSGCNNYSLDYKRGVSHPISLWTDTDVEQYVNDEQVELSEIYTQYQQKRTGCVNCPYGAHCNDDSRFDLLKRIEPARYDYFMSTKLRKILALSDVDILSDLEYMLYKNLVQEDVKHWHKEAKGIDKYLAWKVRYALSIYTAVELLDGVKHIEMYPLKYPIEKILDEIEKERER
ncbi:phosphoadenosine phosphosulfate reductase family protein [[Clostridium] innocuum]|uniref:phosphoadenosine phosphosulfate reductase domain-containing protein n=2 Tax=Clostridium innocuum TaxID=1522 RepID=UPI001F5A7765|nr:phosphoadenosine phosphosulfate reductase family protein [[Clostridium] innocuum]MCR0209510.1 phosphoadenosine phosphosulfate reductase family protein [[Clostridium] innocuum]MCR0220996.1 phosphoadenosine phosphosulfate reductase family protein [[Clostridium] innocuum]MCR0316125.1 phosphoadenosine phosphosulfate reductase family protein [[Clostridium] innocuum]MCR0345524.1 phosphoadenosine phosphosulfate reductase family protein [[Clostridium] innocuum]